MKRLIVVLMLGAFAFSTPLLAETLEVTENSFENPFSTESIQLENQEVFTVSKYQIEVDYDVILTEVPSVETPRLVRFTNERIISNVPEPPLVYLSDPYKPNPRDGLSWNGIKNKNHFFAFKYVQRQ